MMHRADREAAAAQLAAARLDHRLIRQLPDALRPRDVAEAYDLQDAVHATLEAAGHGRVIGHKIGCTTPVMQAFLNIPSPCAGGVFDTTAQLIDGRFRHADFRHVGVECEIAVRLGADLSDGPFDRVSVAAGVAEAMAAIEVVDDRYDDYKTFDTPTLIADDFFDAGCVLGAPVADWQSIDLAALHGRMTINGADVGQGIGGDIMGHPLEALAWLASMRADQGVPLRAGAFILLGSVVETKWVEQGDLVEIDIDQLGRASARFE
jgi:2-oxo-3-hexenedioate decarboxylase/2-keto-4-pentenoate hydratase